MDYQSLRLRRKDNSVEVFDPVRKKYVAFTPEENVRQHFVNHLIHNLSYPLSLIANEIGIELNGTRKRCDTVVFSKSMKPLAIIEYKAPEVNITQEVFNQIVRYNEVLKAPVLIVTNGRQQFCCAIEYGTGSVRFLPEIPRWADLENLARLP